MHPLLSISCSSASSAFSLSVNSPFLDLSIIALRLLVDSSFFLRSVFEKGFGKGSGEPGVVAGALGTGIARCLDGDEGTCLMDWLAFGRGMAFVPVLGCWAPEH